MKDELFWCQIPDAARMISKIRDNLLTGKHTILHTSAHMPWAQTMRRILKEDVSSKDHIRAFKEVDAEDIPDTQDGMGEYLLRHFCKEELRVRFRPRMGYAHFLADNDDECTLPSTYLWIRGASALQVRAWMPFLKDYAADIKSMHRSGCICFIETADEEEQAVKGVQEVFYNQEVTSYDCYVFYFLMAAEVQADSSMKEYLASLAAELAGTDIELGAACIGKSMQFLENPEACLAQLDGETDSMGHPFAIDGAQKRLGNAVWNTQVKLLFPVLEQERGAFLAKYSHRLQDILNRTSVYNSAGEPVTDYHDVELGLMWSFYWANSPAQKLDLTAQEAAALQLLREARNKLAHIDTISLPEVQKILSRKK